LNESNEGLVFGRSPARIPRGVVPLLAACVLLLLGCEFGVDRQPLSGLVQDTLTAEGRMVQLGALWAGDWPRLDLLGVDTLLSPASEAPAVGRMGHLAFGEDQNLVLVDEMSQEVWLREAHSARWTLLTQQGGGPTEIGYAGGLWWEGDTISIYDSRASRLLRLTEDGSAVGPGIRLAQPSRTETRAALGPVRGGILLVTTGMPDITALPGEQRPLRTLVRVGITDGTSTSWDTLGVWKGKTWAVLANGYGPVPFSPDAFLAARGEHVVACDGGAPEVMELSVAGGAVTRLSWVDPPRPAESLKAAFIERSLEQVPPEGRPTVRAILESMQMPDSLPAVGSVLAGPSSVWVARWFGTDLEYPEQAWPPTEWRWIGLASPVSVRALDLPSGMLPVEAVDDSTLLVLLRDDMAREGVGIAHLRTSNHD
jgi:hypothetical protein